MAFDVADQDITQLFKNDDTFFIPRYQRNYVWKELNWSQLIKDIRYCAEVTPDWSHFIGSMVFERKQKSGGLVNIIDGQQRILTLQIVIFAMIYCYRNIKNKSEDHSIINICDVNIAYLHDLIINRTLGKTESIKVENGYEEYVDLNQTFMELTEEKLKKIDELLNGDGNKKSVILQAFMFFVNDFCELDFDGLVLLTNQFLKTRVVAISSMQEEEVYNIFEILNARGVKLKQIELLKNYLFKYLKPKAQLDKYKNRWADLELLLEDIDLDDYYLHIFRCWYYIKDLSKERLFEVTKEQLRKEDGMNLEDFFNFFINCGQYYRAIYDAKGNSVEAEVYEYFKLKGNHQVRSVLLALKIKNIEMILGKSLYDRLLYLIRNFFVIFNLDKGVSNRIDKDIYVMATGIYKANEEQQIEYEVFRFLNKFSVYFEREDVLEKGLSNIIYSNKTTRKNVSSKLLVYFFRPLLLEYEKNEYVSYDFSKFNVEHILNDDENDQHKCLLGNLLLCPNEINKVMKNREYSKKREKMLNSHIPYLKAFAEKYDKFDETCIKKRTLDIIEKFRSIYLISDNEVKERFSILQMYIDLKKQMIVAFGENNKYVKELVEKGMDKFVQYVHKNETLPKDDVDIIVECLENASNKRVLFMNKVKITSGDLM